jgi:RNA recognition motif-containing protein
MNRVRIMGNRLYVGNLSFHATADTIRAAFAPFGVVSDVHVASDRETGQSRGFAFVTMGTSQEAQNAMAQMNGAMLDGRSLRVNDAEERQGGGGGGGGGRGGGGRGGGGRDGGKRW